MAVVDLSDYVLVACLFFCSVTRICILSKRFWSRVVDNLCKHNSNTIRIERSISCQSGNTIGRKDKKKAWAEVTDEKLPCRKKKRVTQ